jgi:hypothetical protein
MAVVEGGVKQKNTRHRIGRQESKRVAHVTHVIQAGNFRHHALPNSRQSAGATRVRLYVPIASDHRAVPDHHPWMDIASHGVLAGCRRTLLEQQSPFPSRVPVLQIAPA